MEYLFYTQFFSTTFLSGLCWFVQIIHYPLLSKIEAANFQVYHNYYLKKAGRVIAPAMLIEISAAILLLIFHREQLVEMPFFSINLLSICAIWLSTFLVQVPLHRKLSQDAEKLEREELIDKLVQSNWIRTSLWSARILLFFSIL